MSHPIDIPESFRLISTDELDEYRAKGFLFEHIPTGCQIYHVHNDDEENMFSFNFRTPPSDSTGVAHILEHSVLCGSKHFPVKDPFLSMMKGSVNTYLNAMTYPDKTLYPSASMLEKDYFNLMHVYGDAVFFPLLKKEVFRQEGHRLERNEEGYLRRVGVVYNEMKGNYSSHEGIVAEWSIRSLFPDNSYSVDSGGDPESIPTLTYEQFVEFHHKWYHPSNCRIFLYGNISSEKNLKFLEVKFLSSYTRKEVDSTVSIQSPWKAPIEMELSYPSAEDDGIEGKSTLMLNWKTAGPDDPVRSLSLSIMTEMLMGNSGAPLQKALHDSGLGEDVSPVSGMDFDLNEAVFSIGLRGSDPEKKEKFRALVFSVLKGIVKNGFPEDLKESCLRLVEFRAREIKGGGPFGLRLLKKALKGWNYDLPPVLTMRFDSVMKQLREKAEQKGYFEGLLREWILDNPHYSLLIVKPDPESRNKQEERLKNELEKIDASLSEKEKADLDQENHKLRIFQEEEDSPQARETIPSLHRDDIPRKIRTIPCERDQTEGFPVLRQNVFTNGILYSDMAFDLSVLNDEFYPYLPLFCRSLTATGLPGIPFEVVTRDLAMKTGGFAASLEASFSLDRSQEDTPDCYLYVRLKMLESQSQEALDLAAKLLLEANFDDSLRLEQILTELRNDMKASLIPGGHSYVSLRTTRHLSKASAQEDQWFGISQLQFLMDLKAEGLAGVFKQIRNRIFSQSGLTMSLSMDESVMDKHYREIQAHWKKILPVSAGKNEELDPEMPRNGSNKLSEEQIQEEGLAIPALIGFVGAAIKGSRLGSNEHAAQILLSHMLKTGPLWEKIRMKGGAYGAFSSLSGIEETFSFASYRDPHIEDSLDAFKESLQDYLHFSDSEELGKSLISVVGKELTPLSPAEKGMISLKRDLYSISDEIRQKKRDQLMGMSEQDICGAAEYLLDQWEQAFISVMAHPDHLDRASARWPGLKDHRIDLPQ